MINLLSKDTEKAVTCTTLFPRKVNALFVQDVSKDRKDDLQDKLMVLQVSLNAVGRLFVVIKTSCQVFSTGISYSYIL